VSGLVLVDINCGSVHGAAAHSSVPTVANLSEELQHFCGSEQSLRRLFRDRRDKGDGSLFEGTLLESGGSLLKRAPWAAIASFAFQSVVIALLIIVPLLYTDPLPTRHAVTHLVAPPPPPPPSAGGTKLRVPTDMPKGARMPMSPKALTFPKTPSTPKVPPESPDQAVTASGMTEGVPGGIVGGVPGGLVGGVSGGVLGGILSTSLPMKPRLAEPAPPKKIHVASRVAEGNLVFDVKPEYPPEAGRARIEGAVVLQAVIGKDGSVQDVQVKSGLPVLVQAAINAVRQWRYRPYLLNGKPIEVDTQITINFTLSGA
jgi:protein TonB